MKTFVYALVLVMGMASQSAAWASLRITEWMYGGAGGEFVEFTNLGSAPVDMRRWSFDDNGRRVGQLDLSAFGVVNPGESVLITESSAAAFRAEWGLSQKIKIIGGYTNNLGRSDEINLYNAAGYRVDRLSFGDETLGGPRTDGVSARSSSFGVLGLNDVRRWVASSANDGERSVRSVRGDVGSPGRTSYASFRGRLPPELPPYRLVINTDGALPIADKETYVPARFTLSDFKGNVLHDVRTEIRGRGNSTWSMPKKPYRLRLNSSSELLDMPANRHWVLLANYADKSLIRTDLVLALAHRIGQPWASRSRHVELTLNGRYEGVYQLAEHVRIGPYRVNIPSLGASQTGPDVITGGYLLEADLRRGEDFCFDSSLTGIVFCAADPESLLDANRSAQRQYITAYIEAFEQALLGAQFKDPQLGWRAYLDVASAVDYYIVNELTKNVDSNMTFSPYMYKPRNGKLHLGPFWDFDVTLGNIDYGDGPFLAEGWLLRGRWFGRLLQDEYFVQQLHSRWAQLKADGVFAWMFSYIDDRAAYLSSAQVRNFQQWPILNTYVWPNRVVTGSYTGEVVALKDWLQRRLAWMDVELSINKVGPGAGPGLFAQCYSNPDLSGQPVYTTTEDPNRIWYDEPGQGIGLNNWSVRWSGVVEAESSGSYELEVSSDDRIRVWINGQLVANQWGDAKGGTIYRSAPINLVGGARYPIVIEHADLTGPSTVSVFWKLPGRLTSNQLPRDRMYAQ